MTPELRRVPFLQAVYLVAAVQWENLQGGFEREESVLRNVQRFDDLPLCRIDMRRQCGMFGQDARARRIACDGGQLRNRWRTHEQRYLTSLKGPR
jgi:hypothetical protein